MNKDLHEAGHVVVARALGLKPNGTMRISSSSAFPCRRTYCSIFTIALGRNGSIS